jgi:uncharacterized protein (DUF488 family)
MTAQRLHEKRHRNIIFTIGHSTRTIDEFINLLNAYGINLLVDVRTIPKSRHNPQFCKEPLAQALRNSNIGYKHMKGLGGLRHANKDSPNMAWRNSSFRGYADYMQTKGFLHSLKDLIELSKKKKVAIMCAEAVPWRCHRSLIGDALLAHHRNVIDIMSLKDSRPHNLTPWAVVHRGKVKYPDSSTVSEHAT